MSLELIKKGLAALTSSAPKKSPDDLGSKPGKKDVKGGLRGKSFEEGEAALKPEDEKEDKATSKGSKSKKASDKRTLGEKLEDGLSLGGMLGNKKAWTERKWRECDEWLAHIGLEQVTKSYRMLFVDFLKKEFSTENLYALEAIRSGMPNEKFFERFLDAKAPEEINTDKLGDARAGAARGDYSAVDYVEIKKNLMLNLSDSYSRALYDDSFMCGVFRMKTQQTPPKTARGYYE